MNTVWVARAVLAGILIFASALAIERVLAWFNRPRRWVWLTALIAAIALPVVATTAPEAMPVLGFDRPAPSSGLEVARAGPAAVSKVRAPTVDARPAPIVVGPARRSAASWWLTASIVLLIFASAAAARLAVIRSHATDAVVDGVAVKLTANLGPLVTGLFTPAILVPGWVVSATKTEQRLILAHEREHIAGGDHWLVPLGALLLIVMPWNPTVWMLYRRLRLAIETDCDARVVSRGADRREYGATLLRVAGSAGPHGLLSPAWTNRAGDLEHRVRELTATLPRWRVVRSALLSLGAVIVVAVACDAAAPDAAAVSAPPGQSMHPRRTMHSTADITGKVQPPPVRMRLVAAPSAPRQQGLGPGFVRVTGYTREVLRARVVVSRGGTIEVQRGTRVISTSGDTLVEFHTPALLRIRGDQYRAVAEALESGTEVEIVGTHPGGGYPRAATARGPSPTVNFDRGPPAPTNDSVLTQTIRNLDGTISAITTIVNQTRDARRVRSATYITNETIPALNPGEIRVDEESGASIRVVVRFAGGILSINGRSMDGLPAGEHEIETTTPVLVKFADDVNFGVAFVADSTQSIKAYARGTSRTAFEHVAGHYTAALIICHRAGRGGGISGYRPGTPFAEACRF